MWRQIYNTFLLILSVITIAFCFIVVGNIITIGDKIGSVVHPYMEYAFYVIIILLVIIFILVPTLRVITTPTLPVLEIDDQMMDRAKIKKLAKRLLNSWDCIPKNDCNRNSRHENLRKSISDKSADTELLSQSVKAEINTRFDVAKTEILKSAAVSFGSTAISQNSTIDTLSVLIINCKLIHRIISVIGFRPNVKQTIRIYVNVIFSAFFAHLSQSGAEQSASVIMNQFVGGLKKIPFGEILAGSVIDGTINALITLRVGFLTVSYLKKGAKGQISDEENSLAVKSAIKTLPQIVGNKAKAIVDFVTKFFINDKKVDISTDEGNASTESKKWLNLKQILPSKKTEAV